MSTVGGEWWSCGTYQEAVTGVIEAALQYLYLPGSRDWGHRSSTPVSLLTREP